MRSLPPKLGNEERPPEPEGPTDFASLTAGIAERQVALQRWRVILAAAGALIALVTLLVMVRSCQPA